MLFGPAVRWRGASDRPPQLSGFWSHYLSKMAWRNAKRAVALCSAGGSPITLTSERFVTAQSELT
jgi:hypothetical protein